MKTDFFERIQQDFYLKGLIEEFDFMELTKNEILVPILFKEIGNKGFKLFFAVLNPNKLEIDLYDPSDYLLLKDSNLLISNFFT